MKFLQCFLTSVAVMLLVSACAQNSMVVIVPPAPSAAAHPSGPTPPGSNITEHQFLIAQPCLLTPQEVQTKIYATARIVSGAQVPASPHALGDAMSGCASVKFRLASNGVPSEVQLVKENPKDYGFGEQILQAVRASVYEAPTDTKQWYYQTSVITQHGRATTIFSGGPDHYAKYATFF